MKYIIIILSLFFQSMQAVEDNEELYNLIQNKLPAEIRYKIFEEAKLFLIVENIKNIKESDEAFMKRLNRTYGGVSQIRHYKIQHPLQKDYLLGFSMKVMHDSQSKVALFSGLNHVFDKLEFFPLSELFNENLSDYYSRIINMSPNVQYMILCNPKKAKLLIYSRHNVTHRKKQLIIQLNQNLKNIQGVSITNNGSTIAVLFKNNDDAFFIKVFEIHNDALIEKETIKVDDEEHRKGGMILRSFGFNKQGTKLGIFYSPYVQHNEKYSSCILTPIQFAYSDILENEDEDSLLKYILKIKQ